MPQRVILCCMSYYYGCDLLNSLVFFNSVNHTKENLPLIREPDGPDAHFWHVFGPFNFCPSTNNSPPVYATRPTIIDIIWSLSA